MKELSRYLQTLVVIIPLIITVSLIAANIALDRMELRSDIDIQTTAYIGRTRQNLMTDVNTLSSAIVFIKQTMDGQSEEQKQAEVIRLLETVSSRDKGYFFVADYDGNVRLGPAAGKNLIDIQDKNGLFVVRELIKKAKAGGGFVSYVMPAVDERTVNMPKLSYVTGLDDWRWYLGAGVLLTDIDRINGDLTGRMMANTRAKLAVLLLLTGVFALMITAFNRMAYRNIQGNFDMLISYMKSGAAENIKIRLERFTIKEIKTIATFAAGMIEQRAQTEEFRKSVFESSHIPIIIMDGTTSRFMDCNPAALAIYHLSSKGELIGKSPLDFSAPVQYDGTRSSEKVAFYLERAMVRGSAVFEWRHQYPEGQLWDAEVHLRCFGIGDNKFLQFSAIDITERKKIEAALKESNDNFKALFSSMNEIVALHEMVYDEAGTPVNYRITDCNRAFTEILGISREAAVGNLADLVYGTSEPPYFAEFSRVAMTGEPYHYESYFAPLDKHFSISVVSPGLNKFATITTDITDIKRIQQVIEEKNRELEQIVYVTSHDLRSPLVNVDGYSRELEFTITVLQKMLEDGAAGEATVGRLRAELPDMVKATNYIRASTRQMDSLLKGLLKLSRLGRAALDIERLDMNELVSRVKTSFEYQGKQLDAEIGIGPLPACKGDFIQVTQVFSNLIGNALKYADPGRKPVITVSGRLDRKRVEYCVEDNGIGIPKEYHAIIFELFHRLDPKKTEGDGLGLTIVKTILTRLDGSIRVESTPGKGSRFYVTLPYSKEGENG